MKSEKSMKDRERKDGEKVVREVVERIKLEAPHADPIIVSALIARIRKRLDDLSKVRL
jgi:hypothetical protein